LTSYYSMMCLPYDMIGVALTNNAYPLMIPTFGREPMLDTNPISVVVPAGEEPPFVLDMATSVAAFGKITLAIVKGEEIPMGWALDEQGRPTNEPRDAVKKGKLIPLGGLLQELGGHKGYGLAVAVDILTGVLAGGTYGNLAVRSPLADETLRYSSSHFFMALDPDWLRPVEEFKSAMDDMLRALKNSAKAEGHDRIYTHGEIEFETERKRLETGIPCHEPHVKRLHELAREFEIPFDI
jgi:L-2-hydroxycarboxylate dehydrogenase (NAD+)